MLTERYAHKIGKIDADIILRSKTITPTSDDMLIFETAKDLFYKAYNRRVSLG